MNSTTDEIYNQNATAVTTKATAEILVIPQALYIVNAILHFSVSIISGFGNTLTIISVVRYPYLRNSAHVFVVTLACCDLGFGFIGPLEQYTLITSIRKQDSDNVVILCKITAVAITTLGYGNLLSIVAMAIDRYIYIAYPLRYSEIVTYRKISLAVGFIIIYSITASTVAVLTSYNIEEGIICHQVAVLGFDTAIYFYVPVALVATGALVIFYGKIALLACKMNQEISALNHTVNPLMGQLKITRTIASVISVFLVTNMFLAIAYFLNTSSESVTTVALMFLGELIWKTNTWVNPFIYGYMNKDFKRAFRTMLRMKNSDDEVQSIGINTVNSHGTQSAIH